MKIKSLLLAVLMSASFVIFCVVNTVALLATGSKIMQKYAIVVDRDIEYSVTSMDASGVIKKAPVLGKKINVVDIEDNKVGPESFNIDSEGNTYVCDPVASKVEVYTPTGEAKKTINLGEEIIPTDVAVDDLGNVFVYDERQDVIFQISTDGKTLASVKVDPDRWIDKAHGPLRVSGSELYFDTSDQEQVLLAKIYKNTLIALSEQELAIPLKPGMVMSSGKKLTVDLLWREKGILNFLDSNGNIDVSIDIALPGIVSIQILQEDVDGNIYLQTERNAGEAVIILEVYKISPTGEILSVVPITGNTGFLVPPVKLLAVTKSGAITQFKLGPTKGKICTYQQQ
ncbi:MAG: hypothetical protein WC955_09340 [Elusimicrobiota bacterium]